MNKLLKVDSRDEEVRGIDNRVFTVRVGVIQADNHNILYEKLYTTNKLHEKVGQIKLHTALHKMMDEALEVLFSE